MEGWKVENKAINGRFMDGQADRYIAMDGPRDKSTG